MNALEFFVVGLPVPQGSMARAKFSVRHSNERTLMPWRADVAAAAIQAKADGGWLVADEPVGVHLRFVMPRLATHYLPPNSKRPERTLRDGAPYFPTTAPDLDKLVRAILDALTSSGVLSDDSIVVRLRAEKVYSNDGVTGCNVMVWRKP